MSRRALLVGVVGVVVIVAIWYVALWSPRGTALQRARADRDAAQDEVSGARLDLARLQAAAKDRPALEAQLASLRSAVPPDSELAALIDGIDSAAKEAGVSFVSVTPTPPAAPAVAGAPSAIALNIQLKGGYFSELELLRQLAALDRVVVVDGVTLTPDASDPAASEVGLTVTARAFTTASTTKSKTATSSGSGGAGR
jgi:Tfp pilus assembly protein PilO